METPFLVDSLETNPFPEVGYRDYDLGVRFRDAVEREPRSSEFSSHAIRRDGSTSWFMGPSVLGAPAESQAPVFYVPAATSRT